LGFRPPQYVPDLVDYAAYTCARDDFLRLPRACVALLRGGIVWRLAIESLSALATLEGPSLNSVALGHSWKHPDGTLLYDDEISDMEMYITSFNHANSLLGNKEQCSEDSWWPKHLQWAACGLNMGYWTLSCDVWFQIRLEEIHRGKAVLRNGAGWRSALKFQR
ncbi:hypothetical protein K439DRAFT_1307602, partial [Ramaria rubella]